MEKRVTYFYAVIVLTISLVVFGNASCAYAAENNRITKGVFIDGVDVGGLTVKEAEEKIENYVRELRDREISIQVYNNMVTAKIGDLGYSYKTRNVIEQALKLGTTGNLIRRYKDLKDIEHDGINYSLKYTLDENLVRELVSTKVTEFNIEPVNATVARINGEMVYTDHVPGKKVNVDATVSSIIDTISNAWDKNNIILDAYMEDVAPIYTREIVEKCNTLLGSFSTEYADSAEGRAANLANGARLINNTVVYPGEVFSGYEHLAPFNSKNGYYKAGAYKEGKVIDSVGGGACQVTTTLYNAVLEAELEVVERHAHSMTISYVDLSRDAAIAGTYKDLKFKNNTDVPILIQAYTKGRRITFNIWGHETRDTNSRKIVFETRVLSETPPPPDVIYEDPSKPVTYKKVTQSAHTGYRAELYKIVYENGVEVSRTLINKSSYNPAPRYITVGTKEVEKVPDNPEGADSDDNNDQEWDSDFDNNQEEQDTQNNTDNQNEQLQDDVYWDSDWDEEGLEDE